MIFHVVKSWQVLAVTLVLILYMYLVTYVARTYHRPHFVSRAKPKRVKPPPKEKKEKKEKAEKTEGPIETESEDDLV